MLPTKQPEEHSRHNDVTQMTKVSKKYLHHLQRYLPASEFGASVKETVRSWATARVDGRPYSCKLWFTACEWL